MSQTEASHIIVAPGIVRRADRGLCLAGKRVTLYLIMDYLKAGWPPHLIRHWLDLSEAELHHAVQYIETNRTAFEAEYAEVVQQAQAREQYWRERQHQRQPKMRERHFTPEQAAAWARLKALKDAAERFDRLLAESGVTEEELVADFKAWRAKKRKRS